MATTLIQIVLATILIQIVHGYNTDTNSSCYNNDTNSTGYNNDTNSTCYNNDTKSTPDFFLKKNARTSAIKPTECPNVKNKPSQNDAGSPHKTSVTPHYISNTC